MASKLVRGLLILRVLSGKLSSSAITGSPFPSLSLFVRHAVPI